MPRCASSLNQLAAVAPVDDVEPAANASVDLGTHDLARCFCKQPFSRSLRIKLCIENALGRRAESACHTGTDLLLGVDGHGSFSVLRFQAKGMKTKRSYFDTN